MKYAALICILSLAACDVAADGLLVDPDPGGGGNPGSTVSFEMDILPLFQADCGNCHAGGGAGSLDLDSYDGVIAGGVSGAAVIPFEPDLSLLPRRLDGTVLPVMPEDGPPWLEPDIERVKQWILEGALDN